jgi:F-type H+-transporting ATPase subunit b
MLQKKPLLLILLVVPLLLFMSYAEESHGSQTKDFLGKALNFLLLFGGLVYLLRKPLGKILQGRTESIGEELRSAKESREEAAEKLAKVETRLANLDKEVEKLRQEAHEEGKALHQRIVDEARRDAERLKHYASQEIEMLTQTAIRDIKAFAGALAADLARQKIQSLLTEEDQSSLIEKSIERLDMIHEKSNSDTKIRPRTH